MSVNQYAARPAKKLTAFRPARREMQCAMNHSGNSRLSTHLPALGYTSSITPAITLSAPEMSDTTGPKPW